MADPGTSDPGTAELQLGIAPCRKADALVVGVFTLRMAPFSFERGRDLSAGLMPSWSSAVPEGPNHGFRRLEDSGTVVSHCYRPFISGGPK
jgi:hypothetical protein